MLQEHDTSDGEGADVEASQLDPYTEAEQEKREVGR